jgi:hypothetical protein
MGKKKARFLGEESGESLGGKAGKKHLVISLLTGHAARFRGPNWAA